MSAVVCFQRVILAACDYQCMAVQGAIDGLAAEFGDSPERPARARLLEYLDQCVRWGDQGCSDLFDTIMVAWARAPLKRATGLDRDQWIRVFDTQAKREASHE